MKKKNWIWIGCFLLLLVVVTTTKVWYKDQEVNELYGTVIEKTETTIRIEDENKTTYTFEAEDTMCDVGESIIIEYTGVLNSDEIMEENFVRCRLNPVAMEKDDTTAPPEENGLFSQYKILAENKLKTMTLDEKIGQLLLVRYDPATVEQDLQKYQFGGFVFFEKDFTGKDREAVRKMISDLQEKAKIPLLTAVDEEGGSIVRVSSNPNLAEKRFESPRTVYEKGIEEVKNDTIKKSALLNDLGLNVNLAPVVDVSESPSDYMYARTIGKDKTETSQYAQAVISASKGTQVSYTLKHFPGYGNNVDTHKGSSEDNRTLEQLRQNDFLPFEAGINAGAEAVLVSHNTVTQVDSENPASLSSKIHELLRQELNFTGVIMTDDLDMGAVASIPNASLKAFQAGNDLIMTTGYDKSFQEIKQAVEDGTITEEEINDHVQRILSWKYYKGIMYENSK